MAGKEISEDAIRKVLEAAGIQVDDIRVKAVVAALKNIDIEEAIKSAAVPMVTAPAAAPAAAPAEEAKAEEKAEAEEAKEEEEKEALTEEEIAAGLEALFG